MTEMVVVKSKIKEVAKDCNVAGDFADALNGAAQEHVDRACTRADANSRKTLQAKDVFLGKIRSEPTLVVKSKVKGLVSGHNVSGDFADALNEVLIQHVEQACERAKANSRKTVSSKDL